MRPRFCLLTPSALSAVLLGLLSACDSTATVEGPPPGRIVFQRTVAVTDSTYTSNLYVMNGDGTGVSALTDDGGRDALSWRHSPWSPDGRQIAFMSDRARPDYVFDIYVVGVDGTGLTNLTQHPANDILPHWAPDGRQLVFSRFPGGASDVFRVALDGPPAENLTAHEAYDDEPIWSPDGARIAFLSNRVAVPGGGYELWTMNPDGSGLTMLVDGHVGGIAWAPDGSRIAMTKINGPSSFDVYVIDADGTNLVNLTNDGCSSMGAWSPDGTRIAFDGNCEGNLEIYVMNADGSGRRNLTNHPAYDSFPSWSPDGTHLVFCTDRGGNDDIFILNVETGETTNLTRTPELEQRPFWSPVE